MSTAQQLDEDLLRENLKKGIWVDKNGKEWLINKMTTAHIRSCMTEANTTKDLRFWYHTLFSKELERRSSRRK